MFRLQQARAIVMPLFATAIVIGIAGCGIEPETISRIEQMAKQSQGSFAGIDDSFADPVTRTAHSDAFSLPFPDRRDPFHIGQAGSEVPAPNVNAANVSVIGFAKLGEQQAILRVGDKTQFVVVGDHIGDLEVLAISPPRVRLQHGNLIWDASMFGQRSSGEAALP